MALLSVKGILSGKFAGEININVTPARKFVHGLLVSSNFHYPVPRDDKGTAQSTEVPNYVQQTWKAALEKARSVAYQIFEKIKK